MGDYREINASYMKKIMKNSRNFKTFESQKKTIIKYYVSYADAN